MAAQFDLLVADSSGLKVRGFMVISGFFSVDQTA